MEKIKRLKNNLPLVISLSIHIIAALILMWIPLNYVANQIGATVSIEWVNNLPEVSIKRSVTPAPKEFLQVKKDSNKDTKDGSRKKTILTSDSKIAWVLKKSDRKVKQSVEINKFPRRESLPDLMTASELKPDASSLTSLVSTKVGPVDGDGVVGNQVRAKGTGGKGLRSGATILGLGGRGDGTSGDGTTGSGGGRGTGNGDGLGKSGDKLGIIDFINEQGEPKDHILP